MGRFKELSGTRKVYSRSLNIGVSYVANIWSRKKYPIEPIAGKFIGYGSNFGKILNYIPKLNTIPNNTSIYLENSDGVYEFQIRDKAVWFNVDGIDRRVTFSYDDQALGANAVHLSKEDLKEASILDKSKKQFNNAYKIFNHMKSMRPDCFALASETRDDIFLEKTELFFGSSNLEVLKNIKDKFLVNDQSIFINPIPLSRNNKFDIFKFRIYKNINSIYSNMKGTRKINFSKFINIPKNELDYNLNIYRNSHIEKIVDTIQMSNVDIVLDDKILKIDENIKKLIFSFFISYNNFSYGYCYESILKREKIKILIPDDYSTIIDSFLN